MRILAVNTGNYTKYLLAIPLLLGLYELFMAIFSAPSDFSSYSRVAGPLFIVIMATQFLISNISKKETDPNFQSFTNGVLVYFSIIPFLYIPVNFLVTTSANVKFAFWLTVLLLTILFYGFLAIIVWTRGKTLSK